MIQEYFGVKFLKAKFSGLDGRTKVTFEEQSGLAQPFTVVLTPSGMSFKGELSKEITNMNDLQEWAKFISECWQEHTRLSPKLQKTFTGH